MHIVLNVGHQHMLAIIPAHQINLADETVRDSLSCVAKRLEALLQRRSLQFDCTVLGVHIERMEPSSESAAVVNTISDVINYAKELEHDVVRFVAMPDIEGTARSHLTLCALDAGEECSIGVHRVREQEKGRINDMLTDIQMRGVHKPEIFW